MSTVKLFLNLTIIAILLFVGIAFSIIRLLAITALVIVRLVHERRPRILEAWSQRSGGRAARAEHDENVTVLA